MSTISKKTALEIANNNGYYPGDPQAYAVIEFKNGFHNYQITYAVCHSQAKFIRYVECHEITKILFTTDEVLQESFGG
jgi:hypothetical protein